MVNLFAIHRRRFIVTAFALGVAGVCRPVGAQVGSDNTVKPLVVLFPAGQDSGPGILAQAISGGQQTAAERTLEATRKLRDRLADSDGVTPVVYTPKGAMFERAVLEAKLKLANPSEPNLGEQRAIGKAAGAVFVLAVSTQVYRQAGTGYEIVVSGADCEKGKPWNDTAKVTLGRVDAPRPDANAVSLSVGANDPQTALNSAANTLATRLLAGPLGGYSRAVPPAALLPPPSRPAEVAALAVDVEANDGARAARQQAEALLQQNDARSAIPMLRRAINQSPLEFELRALLSRAYMAANRAQESADEAKRALTLLGPSDAALRPQLTRLMIDGLARTGDANAARNVYEDVLKTEPDAVWARLALGDLLLAQSPNDAEIEYRGVLKADPNNREAQLGVARVLAARGDLAGAVARLVPSEAGPGTASDFAARHAASVALFDENAKQIATLLAQNRAAWESKALSREAFYKATSNQAQRAVTLVQLLKQVPPPAGADTDARNSHRRRVSAANLLSQAASQMLAFIETGNADAGAQASLLLVEFRRELDAAQGRSLAGGR